MNTSTKTALALVASPLLLATPAFAQETPANTWDEIYQLFGLSDLNAVVLTGIGVLVPITIAMIGYAIFRKMSKKAPSA